MVLKVFFSLAALGAASQFIWSLPGHEGAPMHWERRLFLSSDLIEETKKFLPQGVYEIFGHAVALHLAGRLEEAKSEYSKLENLPTKDGGTFNLSDASSVLRHNLEMLEQDLSDNKPATKST